jgi:hypothetical protein
MRRVLIFIFSIAAVSSFYAVSLGPVSRLSFRLRRK